MLFQFIELGDLTCWIKPVNLCIVSKKKKYDTEEDETILGHH